MSVIVMGMEMPQECDQCPFFDDRYDYPTCDVTRRSHGYNWNPQGQRMPECPLVEVTGDLKHIVDDCQSWRKKAINYADRIIIASRALNVEALPGSFLAAGELIQHVGYDEAQCGREK